MIITYHVSVSLFNWAPFNENKLFLIGKQDMKLSMNS